jgi:type IV pilus assembly protein PilV
MLSPLSRNPSVRRQSTQRGSVLIESMVALVIFSMGVLALVGLQTAMMKNSSDNRYRAEAQLIAQTHLANMMAFGGDAASYISQVNRETIKAELPNGTLTFSPITNSMVSVTVGWQVPGGAPHQVNASSYLFDVTAE